MPSLRRSVLNGLQGYVQQRMEQMGQFVGEAAKGQAQFLTSMAADAEAFNAKKERDQAALRDQVCHSHGDGVLPLDLCTQTEPFGSRASGVE